MMNSPDGLTDVSVVIVLLWRDERVWKSSACCDRIPSDAVGYDESYDFGQITHCAILQSKFKTCRDTRCHRVFKNSNLPRPDQVENLNGDLVASCVTSSREERTLHWFCHLLKRQRRGMGKAKNSFASGCRLSLEKNFRPKIFIEPRNFFTILWCIFGHWTPEFTHYLIIVHKHFLHQTRINRYADNAAEEKKTE